MTLPQYDGKYPIRWKHPAQMNTDPYSQPPSTGQEHLSQPSSTGSEFPATGMGMAASQGVTSLPTSTHAAPVHSQGREQSANEVHP